MGTLNPVDPAVLVVSLRSRITWIFPPFLQNSVVCGPVCLPQHPPLARKQAVCATKLPLTVFYEWIQSGRLRVGTNRETPVTRNGFGTYAGSFQVASIKAREFRGESHCDSGTSTRHDGCLSSVLKRQGWRPASCRTMERCRLQLIAFPQNGLCS